MGQANELGITMLGVPEELGGAVSERSAVTSALVTEALGRGDMGLAVAALSPAAVATAIGLWGDSGQQGTYLPELVGDDVPAAALAIQEPTALFDPFELKTTATKTADGYKLDGEKSLVARGVDSELFIVGADARRPPRALHRRGEDEGSPGRAEARDGHPGCRDGEPEARRRRGPAESLLGEGSPDVYADCVRLGRIAWAALAVGTAQAVVDYVIPYVNERIAFGEPISHRQAVAFKIADMATELEGMRLVMLRAASRVDQGLDFARESALARRIVAQKGMQIGSDGVQLLGGHGYIKEHPVERWYRDLRAAGVLEGGLFWS